jgi:hypothetical protein
LALLCHFVPERCAQTKAKINHPRRQAYDKVLDDFINTWLQPVVCDNSIIHMDDRIVASWQWSSAMPPAASARKTVELKRLA